MYNGASWTVYVLITATTIYNVWLNTAGFFLFLFFFQTFKCLLMLKSDHIFHSAVNIMMSLQVPDTKDQDSLCHAACHVEWIQERRHHSKGAVSKSRESEFCCENDAEGDCLWFPLNECPEWMNWMIVCAFVELLIVFAFAEWMIVCVFAEWMKWIIVWCTYLLIFCHK